LQACNDLSFKHSTIWEPSAAIFDHFWPVRHLGDNLHVIKRQQDLAKALAHRLVISHL
jgi:hypothetical protein